MCTKHKPTATVLPQLLQLHSTVREIGGKEDRRGKKKRWWMCASLGTACVTNHTWPCKCHSAFGSLDDSQVLCRPKFKNQRREDSIAAVREKPQGKKKTKTKHKILYVQVFTYLYIHWRKTTEVTYTAWPLVQWTSNTHLGLLVALELFGNSSVVPFVTRAGKAEVLTSHLKLRISL